MCMRGDKMLRILVVGWKRDICRKALIEALQDHSFNLIMDSDKIVDSKDNTIYYIITNTMNYQRMFYGKIFDQVIYVDDFRYELFRPLATAELYSEITRALEKSCVPDNHKTIYYEYPYTTEEQKKDYYFRRF